MNNDLISRSALLEALRKESILHRQAFHIDTKALIQHEEEFSACMRVVCSAPTIDAEVVRCRDCKHRGIVRECPMCYTDHFYDEDYGYDYWDVDKTVDDGFCHCGEMDAEVEG